MFKVGDVVRLKDQRIWDPLGTMAHLKGVTAVVVEVTTRSSTGGLGSDGHWVYTWPHLGRDKCWLASSLELATEGEHGEA